MDRAGREPLRLIRALLCGVAPGDFVALAEVAFALPDDRRGGRVPRLFPFDLAVGLPHAMKRAIEGREVDVPLGENRRGDDLAFDGLFPVLLAGPEVEAGQVMAMVSPGIRDRP